MTKLCLILFFVSEIAAAQVTNYVMSYNGSAFNNVGTSVGTGVRSIEFWFKPGVTMDPSTTYPGWTFIGRNDNSEYAEYGVYIRGTDWNGFGDIGRLCFWVRYAGILHEIKSNQSTWTGGACYHVAGVLDPSAGMRLYVNGVLQNETDVSATAAVWADPNNPTCLGSWGPFDRFFFGSMDEMRLWTRAITQNEIQNKMCQSLNPSNETGLHAYYRFNEASGSQLIDGSGNNYNGSINGTTWTVDGCCAACSGDGIAISVTSQTICTSGTATLTANGASTYTWVPAPQFSNSNGSVVLASPAQTTTYTVNGTSTNGCTGQTYVVLTVDSCVNGISKLDAKSFTVFPNPAMECVYILASKPAKYFLSNALGEIIEKGTLIRGETMVNLGLLPEGIYCINLVSDNQTVSKKILVQK